MRKSYTRFTFLYSVLAFACSFCLAGQPAWAQIPSARTVVNSKLAPALRTGNRSHVHTALRVQVKDAAAFKKWATQYLPAASDPVSTTLPAVYLVKGVTAGDVQKLALCPWVTYVDVPNRRAQEESYLQNADFRVNRVTALHSLFPDIHGKGLTVSVKEQPFDTTDIDFKARVKSSAAFQKTVTPHATAMATLVAGAGNTAEASRGVAWQSSLTSSDFTNLAPDDTEELKRQQVSVQNHSYGVGVENYYGLESQAYDRQSLQMPTLLHVFSSGNSGNKAATEGPYASTSGFANLTGQFKVSKNTLSVGAIDTSGQVSILSSRGPTYDGRIKPEVVAFGEAGTSEAASVVSGIALVVQDAYRKQNNGALPPSELVKAAIINAADDKGAPQVDYAAGFGNADALGAVQAIVERRYASTQVSQGATQSIRLTVPKGMGQVKVTLVWSDKEGTPGTDKALVNDLDLVIKETAANRQWLPWGLSVYAHKDSLQAPARRKADHLNNVEQVTIAQPAAGEYEIQVTGYQLEGGQQSFSVVYEYEKAFTWAYPFKDSHLEAGQTSRLRWFTPVKSGATATLEFRYAGSAEPWQTLKEGVMLDQEAVDVALPDTTALAELRMVIGAATYETGTFMLSPMLALQVGYQCGDEVMFFWPSAPGAEAYQVYVLGNQFMEPLAQTRDTVFAFRKSQYQAVQYAVAPMVQVKLGARSFTKDYTLQPVGCYVTSFLPKYFVSDTVLLDLQISTSYGLAAMYLEKRIDGEFKVMQPIALGSKTDFALQDLAPAAGWNEYRVKLVTQSGATFYSQAEGLFYTPDSFIQVYPNPVLAGQDLQIITNSSDINTIFIYDQVGRLVREYAQDGAIKVIETKGLRPGAYFIKVLSPSGNLTQAKVILL
ncbi:S8 family serine peptidase [Nibribacter ruber]|uniref:S8 family serine peptidase n=1 Tax=Nibribacter ruber TaxID=2698458 RepID=A0A6P1P3F1_9BACT|nr:S8 family serine peptidase [Nibribacter ruber]QHL88856.1 S8 family serine peptidase [Nibribacter ruber]